MSESIKKRVDEDWKNRVTQEKQHDEVQVAPSEQGVSEGGSAPSVDASADQQEPLQATFERFITSLAIEGLMALGEMPQPVTRKKEVNVAQAKYLIDLLGILEEKTKGNLNVDEQRLLSDALYQLRMRYMSKA